MVCEELDQLEWDFIQARAGSLEMDSLGWTDREFSCLDAILDHKRRGIRVHVAPGIKSTAARSLLARCRSNLLERFDSCQEVLSAIETTMRASLALP